MILEELRVKDFRNIHESRLGIRSPRVVLLGPNGEGKTNLLEAVHLLCLTRPFRTHRLQQLQRQEADSFQIEGRFQSQRSGRHEVKVRFLAGNLFFELNGKKLARKLDLFGRFPLVLLSPESLEVSQGAPEARRRYLDRLLSMSSASYLDQLLRYQRALKQRTGLLLKSSGNREENDQLDLWEQQLAEHGFALRERRASFLLELETELGLLYREGFAEELVPTLEHRCNLPETQNLAMVWAESREKDRERGWTSLGPHRDEIRIRLDGRTLRDYGSQGQHKLLMLALALAEVRLLKRLTGESPLLLLDDLFGMLDDGRIRRIGEAVDSDTQILISTTSPRHLDVIGKACQVFQCRAGSYHEEAA